MSKYRKPEWTESYLAGYVAGYHDGTKLDDYGLVYVPSQYDEGFYDGMDAACDDAIADDMDGRPELAAWEALQKETP